jgi:hypothetical protein
MHVDTTKLYNIMCTLVATHVILWTLECTLLISNVRGEPVFSVMAAGWFCEKSG